MTHHWRLITDESSSGTAKSYCVILYFPLMLQKKCLTVAPVIPVYPVSGLILRFFWHVSESFTVDAVDSFVVSCSSGFVAWLGGTFFPSVLAFPVSCPALPSAVSFSLDSELSVCILSSCAFSAPAFPFVSFSSSAPAFPASCTSFPSTLSFSFDSELSVCILSSCSFAPSAFPIVSFSWLPSFISASSWISAFCPGLSVFSSVSIISETSLFSSSFITSTTFGVVSSNLGGLSVIFSWLVCSISGAVVS